MNIFVDTSVWSLMLRRDVPSGEEVEFLARALDTGDTVVTTGIVLQELLEGFSGPKTRQQILDRFIALDYLTPERHDHIEAAELRNHCRRNGVQVGTIDILLAELCVRYGLLMLSTDRDFQHVARLSPLKLWRA